jgi:excisionase family DNA binding protein
VNRDSKDSVVAYPVTDDECSSNRPQQSSMEIIQEIQIKTWLTYQQAAIYTGWTVPYLRNLVSAGQIPVYGKLRARRFRRDMLDLFLTNPDAAMRKFRLERNAHGS